MIQVIVCRMFGAKPLHKTNADVLLIIEPFGCVSKYQYISLKMYLNMLPVKFCNFVQVSYVKEHSGVGIKLELRH